MAGHTKWSELKRKTFTPEQIAQIDAEAACEIREIEAQRERASRGIYRIAYEVEDDGAVSAWVEGIPVYAQAKTRDDAERAITELLDAYKKAHPIPPPIT